MRNRRILITRQHAQAGEMIREIESRGGTAVVVPMIATGPPASWTACDDAIGRLGTFDALVFTSVNAVESFVGRTRTLGVPPALLAQVRAVAVGETTASALTLNGMPVILVPEKFSGASLGAALGDSLAGKRVLIPRGNIARETVPDALRRGGAIVETVNAYVTSVPEGIDRGIFVRRVVSGEFDVVTFASPSAAVNFSTLFGAEELREAAGNARIAVIGPSTGDAVRGLGLRVDIIARESTACGLVRSIDEFYRESI
jgi:uroporphyrinogen-III synthase/uroporphyrinogen III methyltransferase/synthase